VRGAEVEVGHVMAAGVLVQQEAQVSCGPVGGRDRQEHAGFTTISLLGQILS
jgi:hypothetical protein